MIAKTFLASFLFIATVNFGFGYNILENMFKSLFPSSTIVKVSEQYATDEEVGGDCPRGYHNCDGVCVPYHCPVSLE